MVENFSIVFKGTTKCPNTIDIFGGGGWGSQEDGCVPGVTDRHLLGQKERIIRAKIPL